MTKLTHALNLTPTKMHSENLLHGSKIRDLVRDVRFAMKEAMKKQGFTAPPKWTEYEKELEKIHSETFTTIRDKSLAKLGMKVSAIATEIHNLLDPTTQSKSDLNRDIKLTPPESPLEKCRKSLLSKLTDAMDQIDNKMKELEGRATILIEQAKKEQNTTKKQELEAEALKCQSSSQILSSTKASYEEIEEKVKTETDISKFPEYEKELYTLHSVKLSSDPTPGSPPVKLDESAFQEKCLQFKAKREKLERVFESKKYAWRVAAVNQLLKLIDEGLQVLEDPKTPLPQKHVASNLLELRLSELENRVRPLAIPLSVQDLESRKNVLDAFVVAMDGIVSTVLSAFQDEADKNQINSVLPKAVQVAKGPIVRLASSLGSITTTTISLANELAVDAYCVQSLRLATQCLDHCANDPLLKAWDKMPDKPTASSADLVKAIEEIVTVFKVGK